MFRVNFRILLNFYNQKWSTYFRVRQPDKQNKRQNRKFKGKSINSTNKISNGKK